MMKQTSIQLKFFLFIDNLREYKKNIILQCGSKKIALEQQDNLHEDIFCGNVSVAKEKLGSKIEYHYLITEEENNATTKTISRDFSKYKPQINNGQNVIMVFDTPEAFYISNETKKKSEQNNDKKKVLLSQSKLSESLLMFVQLDTPLTQLKGLQHFLKQNSFNKLESQFQEKIYQQMRQIADLKEFDYFVKRLPFLSTQFKQKNNFEIFQVLEMSYISQKLSIDQLSNEQNEQLIWFTNNFTFHQWLCLFTQKESILDKEQILNQMTTLLTQGLGKQLESSIQLMQKLPEQVNKSNKQILIQLTKKFWRYLYQGQNDLDKLEFLLKNYQDIRSNFSEQNETLFNYIQPYFQLLTRSNQCLEQFLRKFTEFTSTIDENAVNIQQFFSQQNFVKLREGQRVRLFLECKKNDTVLDIDYQHLIDLIGTNANTFDEACQIFTPLIKTYPKLNYVQSLIKAFKQLTNNITTIDFPNLIQQKEKFLAIASILKEEQPTQEEIDHCEMEEDNSSIEDNIKENKNKNNQTLEVVDLYDIQAQLEELIVKNIAGFKLQEIMEHLINLHDLDQTTNNKNIICQAIQKSIQDNLRNNDYFIRVYRSVYSQYEESQQQKDDEMVDENNQINILVYELVINEFELAAISKCDQIKYNRTNCYDEFTYTFLTLKTLSTQYKDYVSQQLENTLKYIFNFEIQAIEKLFANEQFQNIFNFIRENTYSTFSSPIKEQINNYRRQRCFLKKFLMKYHNYLVEDYVVFEKNFISNIQFNKIEETLSTFQHMKIQYEQNNWASDQIIYQKIFSIIEEKMNKSQEMSFQSLNQILEVVFGNLQKFTSLLLNEKQEALSEVDLFENNIITLKQLKELCGRDYTSSLQSIKQLLDVMSIVYDTDSLESVLSQLYSFIYIQEEGSILKQFTTLFHVNASSRKISDFHKFFSKLLPDSGNEEFQNTSIYQLIQNYITSSENQKILEQSRYLRKPIKLLSNLEEIISYIDTKLRKTSFLDLRELVDEDNIDVIQLLIKLNNNNELLQKIIQFMKSMQDQTIASLLQNTMEFASENLKNPQIFDDLEECIANFYKVSNISLSFDKKKQFISIVCDFLYDGVISMQLEQSDSQLLKIDISSSNKKYDESEMRQICSKVLLEQNTTTNILIAAAQANLQRKASSKMEVEDEEEELQQEISELKKKMQQFRDQWFLVEQLQEIILENIEYGNMELNQVNFVYRNAVGQYDNVFKLMKADLQSLEDILKNWKLSLEKTYEQYPLFSVIGFVHYKELYDLFNSRKKSISEDLVELFSYLQVSTESIQPFFQKKKGTNNKKKPTFHEYNLSAIDNSNRVNQDQFHVSLYPISQVQYFNSSELMNMLISKVRLSEKPFNFYQFFYYDKYSKISDFELFLYRYQYLTESKEYFLIFNRETDIKFYNTVIQLIQELNEKLADKENNSSLFIFLNGAIQKEQIPNIPTVSQEFLLKSKQKGKTYSTVYKNLKQQVNIVYSDTPGAGKTFFIQQQMSQNKENSLRIPLNGNGDKKDLIDLVKDKIAENESLKMIHIDLYEIHDYDINYLLFEFIVLKSISIHSNKFIFIDSDINYYIEIQNSLSNEFFNKIHFKEYFNSTQITFDLNQFQILNEELMEEDYENQYICYKYLQALRQADDNYYYLDKNNVSSQIYVKGDTSFTKDFQSLLQTHFLTKLRGQQIQPCFYQLKHFIKLFGSEMDKFEKCIYLDYIFLTKNNPHLLNQGIRTEILRTSYLLCLQVSINKLSTENLIKEKSLSRDEQLHNKAQSIQKFNSLMMNFVTFQEQEMPCITTFFDSYDQVPPCIHELFTSQKEELIYFDQKNRPEALLKWLIKLIHQNEALIYRDYKSIEYSNITKKEIQQVVQKITIQKDNFFKIAMIFMRIRSNTPVIIMGQSGIGKTALIEIMSLIMEAKFVTMNVHAGVTEANVINLINSCISESDKKKIIIFFDEVNTNKLVGGMFKEILVDRCIKGKKIPNNIIPIAAINPYKLKSKKQKEIINLQIHGGIKQELVNKIQSTDLEYMVEPIPESMYKFIWNFDSLNKEDEKSYILQMIIIKNNLKLSKQKAIYQKNKFSDEQLNLIGNTVFFAQGQIRKIMGYESACSLRDVTRFNKLLFWFVKTLKIFQKFGLKVGDQHISIYSVCLSIFVNYTVRLPLPEQRDSFLKECAKQLNLGFKFIKQIINEVTTYLIDQTEVPPGIVKNTSLKSNVFTLFVSILNKIPVVLIGPPGCSKSFSMSIVIKSLKGDQSKSPLFQQFKAVMQLFYQGHIQSTSERIQEVFDKAILEQEKIKQQNQNKKYISLVQIEELGLAEISPHNPLKVLHSILEKPQIAIACISNWPLDQSKMNRMLTVYRLRVNQEELTEIIECIQDHIISSEKESYLIERWKSIKLSTSIMNKISQIYLDYLDLMKENLKKFEQFHGLRDFYSMVKLFYSQQLYKIKHQRDQISEPNNLEELILKCYLRHFSGLQDSRQFLIQAFSRHFSKIQRSSIEKLSSDLELFESNLRERSDYFISRHLMIITEDTSCAADYICSKLAEMKKPYKYLLGSDFKEDLTTENSYQMINQIISCIESGIIVIIENLDNIYQSLYELLNQNYRDLNGKPFCKISFGAESSNIQVADGFKLILLAQQSQINRMDGPLLNRFEKHHFEEKMTINQEGMQQISEISSYFDSPTIKSQFNFTNLKETVQSLAIQHFRIIKTSDDKVHEISNFNQDVIQKVYRLTSLSKSLTFLDQSDEQNKQEYLRSNNHYSLSEFIESRLNQNQQNDKLTNLITIYSHQDCSYISKLDHVFSRIHLSQLVSQNKLQEEFNKLTKNLTSDLQLQNSFLNHAQTILITGDLKTDSYNRLLLVRQKIQEAFSLMEKQLPQKIYKNIFAILLIKTVDQYSILPFSADWEQYYMDDLFPLSFVTKESLKNDFNIKSMIERKEQSLVEVINFKEMIEYFLQNPENISHSYKSIQYKQINREGYQTIRLQQLWEIFSSKMFILKQFNSLVIQILNSLVHDKLKAIGVTSVNDFLKICVIPSKFITQTESLSTATWMAFNAIVQQNLTLIIYLLEKNNLLYMIYNGRYNQYIIKEIMIKLIRIFELESQQLDLSQGIYNGEITVEKFRNINSYELDDNTLDLQFYQSQNILKIVNQIMNNFTGFESRLSLNLNETSILVEKSIKPICEEEDLRQLTQVFQKEFFNDYYKYNQRSISPLQRQILRVILSLNQNVAFDEESNDLFINIIKEIVFNYFYSSDLEEIESVINEFQAFFDIQELIKAFVVSVEQNKYEGTIRDFLNHIVIYIHTSLQSNNDIYRRIKENNINFENCIKKLVDLIDLYQLQTDNEQILFIKQYLFLLQSFYQDILSELNVHQKVLNFIDLEEFQNLNTQYIYEFRSLLKSNSKELPHEQPDIEGVMKKGRKKQNLNQPDEDQFEKMWNKFLLEIILSSVKNKDRHYTSDFMKSIFQLLHQVEQSYQEKQSEIPQDVQIKMNMICLELSLSLNSMEKVIQMFEEENNNQVIEADSTEYIYLTIFADSLQQSVAKVLTSNINNYDKKFEQLFSIIYSNGQLEKMTQMQKLIYLTLFRHLVHEIIHSINNNTKFTTIDKNLKKFFDTLSIKALQIYIVKAFYHQYKQGDLIASKLKESPYFKDNSWMKNYLKGLNGLLSSSFYDKSQIKLYKDNFEKKKDSFKNLLKEYFARYLKDSKNVFGDIYKGKLNTQSYYPFMMYNNIYLFHRDTQNNSQLYQCTNCQEYIFSNACPNLQSRTACLQCGVQIAKGNTYTQQILIHANQKQAELENIKKSHQWKGFYLRLEEDTINFKLDQGTTLDLRIFALIYNLSILIAFEQKSQYNSQVKISPYSLKQQREIQVFTQKINQILRINYEANPTQFLNEQIDIAINQVYQIMRTNRNVSESESQIILFKIINELLSEEEIRTCSDVGERSQSNTVLSQKIQKIITQSQQVIHESKSEHVATILEKDNLNELEQKTMFYRNLRATDLNITTEFIQTYIKQNLKNNEYRILKEFLDLQKIDYISDCLKSLIYFTQQINLLFVKTFSKKQAQDITLLEALDNNRNHPLYQYYLNHFIPNWKRIQEKEVEYNIGCKNYKIQLISEKTKLNNLILTDDKQFGYLPNIIELLVNKQNNFINLIHQYSLQENPEQFGQLISLIENITVESSSKNEKKLKESVIQNINCERQILKKVSSDIYHQYFMSNTEYSKGFTYIQNFSQLQEELVKRVMSGAVTINIEKSQKFFFLSDVSQIGLLSNNQIQQEQLAEDLKTKLRSSFSNKAQVFEMLQKLSTVFQMFKSEQNKSNLSIYSAFDILQIKQNNAQVSSTLQQLKLTHLNGTISCLEELVMDDLVELCNSSYQVPFTDDSQLERIYNFVQKSVTVENFIVALGRFILRCLSQESDNINANSPLFEQLFYIDIYEELWDDSSNVEKEYNQACSFKINIGNSYDLYKRIKARQLKRQQKSISNMMESEENTSTTNIKNMLMETFSDATNYVKNIFFKQQ